RIINTSPYIHFRTGYYPTIDTQLYRLKIFDNSKKSKDIYILMDHTAVIYDLQGQPLWYMPSTKLTADKNLQLRDIKPTMHGTFTATGSNTAFEFDYNGKKIWQAPNNGEVSGENSENYHHEFTKLNSGNYMVAASQKKDLRIPANYEIDEQYIIGGMFTKKGNDYYREIKTDNLIEYDSNGKVIWYWKATDHFSDSEFINTKGLSPNGLAEDMHMNSFFFDENEKVIYLSFRNLNELIKIEYPSGKILKRYGTVWLNDTLKSNKRMFYGQHCIFKTADGEIYLFDNNTNNQLMTDNKTPVPYAVILKENNSKTGIEKFWDFPCDIDSNAEAFCTSGGSVVSLDNGDMLVNMGNAGRIFIVRKDKTVTWNAMPQAIDGNGKWIPVGQYRTNYIKAEDITTFIFNSINSQ
ncbi:MAG TPA: aryl-sulfate sulfotransferase, partial [Saprospiraceae bacterium]|nr:aryl-sulfate sulfotransferase [Saprospiraceae bacterium]